MSTLQIPLKNYVPLKIYNMLVMNKIYTVQQIQHNNIYGWIEEIKAQCFVKTATWGLDIWEEDYGIVTDSTKSYDERRKDLLAKIRGTGVLNEDKIKEIADAYGCDCEIESHWDEYYFIIKFTGVGVPSNFDFFKSIIEKLKPAHLGVTYEFKYETWDEVGGFSWDDASNFTWSQLLADPLHVSNKVVYSKSSKGVYTKMEFK